MMTEMSGCEFVTENLTAWIDGALPSGASIALRNHLQGCAACARAESAARAAIDRHRRLIPRAVTLEGVDPDRVWQRLQAALQEAPDRWWRWWLRPALMGATAAAAAAVVVLLLAGRPENVLVPLGIETPPIEVVQHPDLFRDYAIIEQLDALEHFDTVLAVPLEDSSSAQNG
jgi:predicted anti-sigma-YlaC factor YlaD